jgi:hypothetical protein
MSVGQENSYSNINNDTSNSNYYKYKLHTISILQIKNKGEIYFSRALIHGKMLK